MEISLEILFPGVSMDTANSQPKPFKNEKALFELHTLLWYLQLSGKNQICSMSSGIFNFLCYWHIAALMAKPSPTSWGKEIMATVCAEELCGAA